MESSLKSFNKNRYNIKNNHENSNEKKSGITSAIDINK